MNAVALRETPWKPRQTPHGVLCFCPAVRSRRALREFNEWRAFANAYRGDACVAPAKTCFLTCAMAPRILLASPRPAAEEPKRGAKYQGFKVTQTYPGFRKTGSRFPERDRTGTTDVILSFRPQSPFLRIGRRMHGPASAMDTGRADR